MLNWTVVHKEKKSRAGKYFLVIFIIILILLLTYFLYFQDSLMNYYNKPAAYIHFRLNSNATQYFSDNQEKYDQLLSKYSLNSHLFAPFNKELSVGIFNNNGQPALLISSFLNKQADLTEYDFPYFLKENIIFVSNDQMFLKEYYFENIEKTNFLKKINFNISPNQLLFGQAFIDNDKLNKINFGDYNYLFQYLYKDSRLDKLVMDIYSDKLMISSSAIQLVKLKINNREIILKSPKGAQVSYINTDIKDDFQNFRSYVLNNFKAGQIKLLDSLIDKDLEKLLNSELGLFVNLNGSKPEFVAILSNTEENRVLINDILVKSKAFFNPDLVTKVLPDNTTYEEILINPDNWESKELEGKSCVFHKESPEGVCNCGYLQKNNNLIVFNSESMLNSLKIDDLAQYLSQFRKGQEFMYIMRNTLKNSFDLRLFKDKSTVYPQFYGFLE